MVIHKYELWIHIKIGNAFISKQTGKKSLEMIGCTCLDRKLIELAAVHAILHGRGP